MSPIGPEAPALGPRVRFETADLLRWGLIAFAVVLGLALIGLGGWAWYRAQESKAAVALFNALELAQKAEAPAAPAGSAEAAIQALEAVLREHSGSSAGPQAAFRLGQLHYAAGRYPQSRGAYEIALAKGGSPTLRAMTQLGLAYTWEAERNYGRAQAAYEALLKGLAPTDFLFEEALLDLARVQELGGQRPAAVATYERALKEVPASRRSDDIRTRLASLQSAAK
jgi:tetratricopeptide (TPR) repeat protein